MFTMTYLQWGMQMIRPHRVCGPRFSPECHTLEVTNTARNICIGGLESVRRHYNQKGTSYSYTRSVLKTLSCERRIKFCTYSPVFSPLRFNPAPAPPPTSPLFLISPTSPKNQDKAWNIKYMFLSVKCLFFNVWSSKINGCLSN